MLTTSKRAHSYQCYPAEPAPFSSLSCHHLILFHVDIFIRGKREDSIVREFDSASAVSIQERVNDRKAETDEKPLINLSSSLIVPFSDTALSLALVVQLIKEGERGTLVEK